MRHVRSPLTGGLHWEASLVSLGAPPGFAQGARVWTVRSLCLESSILVDVPFAAIDPVFSDPRSLVLWDRGVLDVEVRTPGPLRAGSAFDTISYGRGGRPGKRSSYEVVEVTPRACKTRLVDSRVFDDALWTMQFEPIEDQTPWSAPST